MGSKIKRLSGNLKVDRKINQYSEDEQLEERENINKVMMPQ